MRARARRRSGGFTLVEVMIALAILAIGLVYLLRAAASNVYAAQKAQMLTAATNLARGKMYEIEERLLTDGYQELDQTEEGNFDDDGWPAITWKAEIVKIELPDMASLQKMEGQGTGQEGQNGTAPETGAAAGGGLLGGLLGMGGTTGDSSNPAGGAIMGTYYTLVSDVLKEAIRKVTLTVSYPVIGGQTESFVVTCYFTDPAVVSKKVGGAPAEDPDGTGTGGGGTGGGGTGGGGTGTGAGGTTNQGGRPGVGVGGIRR